MSRQQRLTVVGLVVAFAGLLAGPVSAVQYTITDLGSLQCKGIGANGQVVGDYLTADSAYHAFLYASGTMQDLGTLGEKNSWAYDVNSSGQVVGASYASPCSWSILTQHAFLYSAGVMHDLGTFGGTMSDAFSINDSGQIAGFASTADNVARHAFLYSDGSMHDLGTLGGTDSSAAGINSSGQIVGSADIAGDSASHAFLWSGGAMYDLGTLGGSESCAEAINADGYVVGYADCAPWTHRRHAFLYIDGTMLDLSDCFGGGDSWAHDINSSGQAVGRFQPIDGGLTHAFLWTSERRAGWLVGSGGYGYMTDLNTLIPSDSGWTLTDAISINDSGQMICYGSNTNGSHALLLTPVPEPMTLGLLAMGGVAIWRRRK